MYHIGIDIGTSSICGVAHNRETGDCEYITKENDAALSSSFKEEKIQDPAKILEHVADIINQFTSRHKDISGIGLAGQMHGIVYVDGNGDAVSPLFTWQDGRGNRMYRAEQTYADYLNSKSDCQVATGYGLVTHFYNSVNGLVPSNASKLCTIMDYVAMKLTGRTTPLTDYSNAAALGFFNKRTLCFDYDVVQEIGLNVDVLPETGPAPSLIGYHKNIPVYAAIGDNQAAFIGAVVEREHAVHITVGTSSQISVYSSDYVEVDGLETRPLPGGGYLLVGAELCGGYAFSLLKKFFAETIRFICGTQVTDDDIYSAMMSISSIKSDGELCVSTLFNGTRLNPDERGVITGISVSNFLPQELVKGFARGICDALYGYYALLPEEIKKSKTHIVASGNGFRKNHLIREACAYRFGLPVVFSSCLEEAAFGASQIPAASISFKNSSLMN